MAAATKAKKAILSTKVKVKVKWVCVHCDLDLRDMTLGQGNDTPLGHEQQLCEILSRSNLKMRSNGLDMDFG